MNPRCCSEFVQEYIASEVTGATYWQGVRVLKCPFDLWVYQEIAFEVKPELVIETGTAYGGSARYWASLFDLQGSGEIVSVDVALRKELPTHPRITYLEGSSTSEEVITAMQAKAQGKSPVMVILDSDHNASHVYKELDLYAPLVTPGSYLIVEDTFMNHPLVFPGITLGPAEALAEWLPQHPEFERDVAREKFGVTWHPGGYLRRKQT